MPLRVGDGAPGFRAPDADGRVWSSGDFAGRAFVLYFYPKDETPGGVAQACAFRNAWSEFEALGLPVLGVSRDPPDAHRAFAERRRLPFVLLSDEDGAMHKAYKARTLGVFPGRVSYLVASDGRIAAIFDSHLRPEAHAEEMLKAAKEILPHA